MSSSESGLSFLEGDGEAVSEEPATEQPEVEPEAPETAETPPKAQPEVEDPAPEPEPEPEERGSVPVATFVEQRIAAQEAKREAEEARKAVEAANRAAQEAQRQLAAMQQQQNAKPAPDFYDDPQGAMQHTMQTQADQAWAVELNRSKYRVRKFLGENASIVDEAEAAFLQAAQHNPGLGQALRQHPEPYDLVVDWHRQQQLLTEIGNDPEAWKAKQLEALTAKAIEAAQAELQTATPGAAAPPPTVGGAVTAASPSVAPTEKSGLSELFG